MKTKTKSFKTKLWIYFALFTAFIFIILWLLQTVFLQSLYNGMLISDTKKAASEIMEGSTKPDIERKIDSIAHQKSLLVMIAEEDGTIIYSSDEFKGIHTRNKPESNIPATKSEAPSKMSVPEADSISTKTSIQEADGISAKVPPQEPDGISSKEPIHGTGNIAHGNDYRSLPGDYNDMLDLLSYSYDSTAEKTTDDYYIFGAYIDYNGYENPVVLYISTPIDATGASVTILQRILFIVTVLSLIAGFVLSWFIAKKFSKPVGRLSDKAEKLGEKDYIPGYEKGFCSELDSLSNTLDKTNEKLMVSKDFQMQLLSNVSHDLRTPLTMIKGYAEMIRDISWEDSNAMKEDVQVIIKESDRLNALVNEILEYSELQTNDKHDAFEEFDLSMLVKGAAERFEKLSLPENVIIEKTIESNVFFNGDSELIERALYNLMDNAVRHTGNGKKIRVGLKESQGKVLIEVQDYGEGIPASEIDHIWDRYYTSRQRKGKGVSGLGLAIVKQIVGIHNGKCYALSKEGEGCTFCLEFNR